MIIGICSFAVIAAVAITAVFAAQSFTYTMNSTVGFTTTGVQGGITRAADATTGLITFNAQDSGTLNMTIPVLTFSNSRSTVTITLRVYNTGGVDFNVTFPTITHANLDITKSARLNAGTATDTFTVSGVAASAQGTAIASCNYAQIIYTLAIKTAYKYTTLSASSLVVTNGAITAA